jgi:hypothetical protein
VAKGHGNRHRPRHDPERLAEHYDTDDTSAEMEPGDQIEQAVTERPSAGDQKTA